MKDNNSGFGFVSTRDQALKSDNIHFGRDAKLTYGRRIADAFNSRPWTESSERIAGYKANPNSISNVADPASQGFVFSGNTAGVTAESVTDGGTKAWRLRDDSSSSNPGYFQNLEATDHQRMFDEGWNFTTTAKVIEGGGLALWSVTDANDPGWGLDASATMNGFQLNLINGDEMEVTLWQNQTNVFNLGAGSAEDFHTFEMIGEAGSSLYDFYIDGSLMASDLDLLDGTGFGSPFENVLLFNSGSTGGTGREVLWAEVSLTAVPEPGSATMLGLLMIGLGLRRNRDNLMR